MSKRSALTILFVFVSMIMLAQPKTYLCVHPSQEMVMDAGLNEWEDVLFTDEFVDISGNEEKRPYLQTRIKMMWDTSFLYIAAVMEEPHLWATVTERDRVIYVDNDFEVFIDPDGDTHNYAEIEINALGTVWDLFLTRPYRDGTTPLNSFDIPGLIYELKLMGTINDPTDIDTGWIIEMAIPWKSLEDLTPGSRKPYTGEFWRMNFSRVHWDLDIENAAYVKKKQPEYNWVWSPQGAVNMHMPEKWGYVFFSDKTAGESVEVPAVPGSEKILTDLRQLYYAQRDYLREHKVYADDISLLELSQVFDEELMPRFSIEASPHQYLISYSDNSSKTWFINQHGRVWSERQLKFWVWMHGNNKISEQEWGERFKMLKENGIHGILMGGGKTVLAKAAPIAVREGLEIQAWTWILNCNNPDIIAQHPDWYSVSREGYTCLEKQPYVGYYKWLCPSRTEVKQYLRSTAADIMQVDALSGFHMDYIRHPDVILPIALWPKYGLVQDHEMPEYDYCYCEICRNNFKKEHGYDPLDLDDPTQDANWRQFRYDIVTDVVREIADELASIDKKLSAAVFPSPEIARKLVRQDWDQWPLNEVFPMVYHSFYNENIDWIGEASWDGVRALPEAVPLYTGLYIPALSPKELNFAIRSALHAGASGVCMFEYGGLTEDHWKIVRKHAGR